MARPRRSRPEHIQERRRRNRPLNTRRTATVAVGKSRFTILREHAFTMTPQGNILGMYQIMVENIFKRMFREDGRRRTLNRNEVHEHVLDQVAQLEQSFHSQRDVQKLANWALRELKKEGRLSRVAPGRYRLSRRRSASPLTAAIDTDNAEEAAEERRLAWLQKRDRHRARTRVEERYRRRHRRLSQTSSSDLLSITPSQQSIQSTDQSIHSTDQSLQSSDRQPLQA